jgi:type VI protein secretion system component Hcp
MMKTASVLMVLAAAHTAFAQETVTVKFDGLGCSTRSGQNTFPIQTWNLGATQAQPVGLGSGAGASRVQISNFTTARALDECSTALFGLVATGRHMDKATLTQTDASGRQTLMTILLEGVTVTSYQVAGSVANPAPAEVVALGFTKITITYYGAGAATRFGWDVAANHAF